MFGADISDLAFLFTVAVAVGGLLIAIVFPMISGNNAARRVDADRGAAWRYRRIPRSRPGWPIA